MRQKIERDGGSWLPSLLVVPPRSYRLWDIEIDIVWTVRKMKESGKLHTICDEMDRIKLEILGISKTNWTNRGCF